MTFSDLVSWPRRTVSALYGGFDAWCNRIAASLVRHSWRVQIEGIHELPSAPYWCVDLARLPKDRVAAILRPVESMRDGNYTVDLIEAMRPPSGYGIVVVREGLLNDEALCGASTLYLDVETCVPPWAEQTPLRVQWHAHAIALRERRIHSKIFREA